MNSYQKYIENLEQEEWFKAVAQKKQEQIYYLQRKLKAKGIQYNSRKKTVNPTSAFTNDKHVQRLLQEHNYTVQTIIV